MANVKFALFVRLEVKPGKEAEVEEFLRSGLAIVQGGAGNGCVVRYEDWAIRLRNLRCLP